MFALSSLASACRGDCHSVNAGKIPPTPEDPPLVCPLAVPPDVHADERAACAFGAGATAEETLGISAQLGREHVVQDHTEVTRFIETVFGLPALTARDANSTALLDLFDFSSCTPPLLPPPEAPASGTGGCR